MHLFFVVLDAFMAIYFVFAAVVNFNDPDPVRWVGIYSAAAITCAVALFAALPWWAPAILGAIALVWAATLAPRVIGKVRAREMFSTWKMRDARVEEAREMYGLLIEVAWMAALAYRAAGR